MARTTPKDWQELMQPLRLNSLRDLALAADVSPQTITRLVFREATSNETVSAVARALKVDEERIWSLYGRDAEITPFRLPLDADRLTPRQRTAVLAVVRAMLDPAVEKGDVHASPAVEKSGPRLRSVPNHATGKAARSGRGANTEKLSAVDRAGEESQDPGDRDP